MPAHGVPRAFLAAFRRTVRDRTPEEARETLLEFLAGRTPPALAGFRPAADGCGEDGTVGPAALEVALEAPGAERHRRGAWATPPAAARYLAREAVARFLCGRKGAGARAALDRLRAVDPACGAGALLAALVLEIEAARRKAGDDGAPEALRRRVLAENLAGVERDLFTAETARRRLALLAPGASPAISAGDALLAPVAGEGRFDIVIMNPPYVPAYSRQSERASLDLPSLRARYGRGRLNLFTCFLLRAAEIASPGGVLAAIVPDTFVAAPSYARVRDALCARFPRQEVVLVRGPLFPACVRSALLVAGPGAPGRRVRAAAGAPDLEPGRALPDAVGAGEARLLQRLLASPLRLDDLFEVRDGVNPGPRAVRTRLLAPGAGDPRARPCLTGADIDPRGFFLRAPAARILWDPSVLSTADRRAGASLRDPRVFRSPKIVSRQTADTLLAALDRDGDLVALNSVHCTRSRRGDLTELLALLALLNSPLLRLAHALAGGETREVLPQVHIRRLRALPLPGDFPTAAPALAAAAERVLAGPRRGPARDDALDAVHAAACAAFHLDAAASAAVLTAYRTRYPRLASSSLDRIG